MSTVIYVFNQTVQIVTGTGGKGGASISQHYAIPTPEGSIINGIVMDQDLFTEFLKKVWADYKLPNKDITLVIGSTKFIGKSMDLPSKLKDRKMLEFITREFADMGRDASSVYSFVKLPGGADKMQKVYAETISPEFITLYVDMFNQVGVKLKAIVPAESSLINYVSLRVAKDYKTFVTIIEDGASLITIVWVNGGFFYYNSVRCFYEQGTQEYADDVARSLSKISQFMQAQKVEQKLEQIVFAGCEESSIPMYRATIESIGMQVPVSRLKSDEQMQHIIPAISGLYINNKMENFLPQYEEVLKNGGLDTGATSGSSFLGRAIILAASFIIMLSIVIVMAVMKNAKQKELDEIVAYNESDAVMFGLMDYDYYSNQNNYLSAQIAAVEEIGDNIQTYPVGNTKLLRIVENCAAGYANISYGDFTANTGSISLTASSENVEMIHQFIKKLTQEDIFCTVDYSGYTYSEINNCWNINVTCILAESAGR